MFPSQLLFCIVLLLSGTSLSCGDPPHSALAAPLSVKESAATPTEPKIEEVILDPMLIVPHSNVDIEAPLGIVSDDSVAAACKTAGDFLVVPLLSEESTYLNCGDQRDAIYVMKLVNCSKEKITFTTFTFTIMLSLNRGETVKSKLADEFTHFELYVDNDHSSYLSIFKPVDAKTGTVPVEVEIDVEPGEEQFCRLKAIRRCSDGDRLELNLDLTGALASKKEAEEDKRVNGAVFNRPDRQVTFMSRN